MTLSPFTIENFSGLDLASDPEQVGLTGAIDLMDVDLDKRGRVRQRDGWTPFGAATGTSGSRLGRMAPAYNPNGWRHILASRDDGGGGKVVAFDNAGGFVVDQPVTGTASYFARIATPTHSYVFHGTVLDLIGRYEPTGATAGNFSVGTNLATVDGTPLLAMPKGGPMAATPVDNRLVVAAHDSLGGPNSTSSSPSHLWFSDAGDPQGWQSNNFVQLSPGDGEMIVALVAWQNYLFAFKESEFFVFYGTTADSSGDPVFNYRAVESGVGCSVGRGKGWPAVAGTDGVYFASRKGIYRTTGGPPERISGPLDPLFDATTSELWTGGALNIGSDVSLAWHDERLFVANNNLILVWDSRVNAWLVWGIPAASLMGFQAVQGGPQSLLFGRSNTNTLAVLGGSSDNGVSINARYRSGLSDLEQGASEKTIRETEMIGTGQLKLAWIRDFESFTDYPVSFGSDRRGRDRHAQHGELLSFRLASDSGQQWTLQRLVPMIRETTGVGHG